MTTVDAYLVPCDPEPCGTCPRCDGITYRISFTAILPTGVMPAGQVIICQHCDTAHAVVKRGLRQFRELIRHRYG